MEETSEQETGAQFGAIVMGGSLGEGAPDPASPLGQLLTFAAEHGVDAVTPSHVAAAREGRAIEG
ncbi:hypothetical protein SEA_SAFTANT_1 [Streptomyces phage Saftant]|uniref:Uncharacterized protein n=1 Tax=Streptomyces phage Saftant TaxID=2601693 RepID=A0A5J6D8M0_9CAUD|nr:hypothetical protein KGG95_gp01 [Streptomyces phage Saftant]QEQ94033.1 hypothetical protein SEA_SAFTANT_1 [Streptomyces phage Saftant]